jgi:hypothetical protein
MLRCSLNPVKIGIELPSTTRAAHGAGAPIRGTAILTIAAHTVMSFRANVCGRYDQGPFPVPEITRSNYFPATPAIPPPCK